MNIPSEWLGSYKLDSIFGAIIVISPFILFSHLLFDDSTNVFSFFGIEITHYLSNNQNFIWQILSSIIPMVLLSILFFTTRSNWRYCLLLLILLYFNRILFQLQIIEEFSDGFTTLIGFLLIKSLLNILILADIFYFSKYRKKAIILSLNDLFNNLIHSRYSIINSQKVINILKPDSEATKFKSLSKMYYIQDLLDKKLKILDKNQSEIFVRQSLRVDLIIGTILLINTLLWFLPYVIPENLQVIKIFNTFTIEANGFSDAHTFIWFTINKLIIIAPLLIWFLSTYYWWKYAIIIPILMYSYQFWEAFQDVDNLDAFGNINTISIFIIIYASIDSPFEVYEGEIQNVGLL